MIPRRFIAIPRPLGNNAMAASCGRQFWIFTLRWSRHARLQALREAAPARRPLRRARSFRLFDRAVGAAAVAASLIAVVALLAGVAPAVAAELFAAAGAAAAVA